jgi:AraC-like DNA-binding protein
MLHFVLRGDGAVRGPDDRLHSLGPCWLAVVPHGAVHALQSSGEVHHERRIEAPSENAGVLPLIAGSSEDPAMQVACGILNVRYGESLRLFEHLRELLAVDLSDVPQVRTAFEGILAEQSQPGPGSEAMQAALMSQCLVHLLRRLCGDPDCPLPWLKALEDPRLARALDRILDNPGANHTVRSLADAASMSRSPFAERFVAAFGLPPMSLVHHVRMQRAAALLRQSHTLSIDEVASRVGFSSRSHLSRAFKQFFGISPTAYREE